MVEGPRLRRLAWWACLAVAGAWPGLSWAQDADAITARATVAVVDPPARSVTLVGAAGNRFTLVVGPQIRQLDQIKEGDIVVVRYRESVAYVLSPPNAELPEPGLALGRRDASENGATVAAPPLKTVVTGVIAAIDPSGRTLQVIDPGAGFVHTIHLPEASVKIDSLKVGDTLSAVVSPAVAVSIEPSR